MSVRPSVNIYSSSEDKVLSTTPLPAVFTAPIRHDIIQFVHTNMAKNDRQAYAVNRLSGMDHPAASWGTGRAKARIPRLHSGVGAFGNMCRGGRMFAPTKIYRKWHRKINIHQKRFAVCSALAASALPSLVMSRGHKIENVNEIPLVISCNENNDKKENVAAFTKTKEALAFLSNINAMDDINEAAASKKIRPGIGKLRNRRYVHKRGPLLILANNNVNNSKAFNNIYGLDMANVNRLNLLHLAPGGHLGRFLIWSKDAFLALDKIFGTFSTPSEVKKNFYLPSNSLTSSDITRIMQSEEVRRVLQPKKLMVRKSKKEDAPRNGLNNKRLRAKLNPFSKQLYANKLSMTKTKNARVEAAKKVKVAKKGKAEKKTGKK